MGKRDFHRQYQIVKALQQRAGKELTIKVSASSDHFDPRKDFAGVIIYHWEGQVEWQNSKIGWPGRSFYVYLVNTESFSADQFRAAGQGRVHDTAVEKIMGIDFRDNKACLGGFSVQKGVTHYSSMWLNMRSSSAFAIHWESDDSKYLSEGERLLVDVAVAQWKARGPNIVVQIPSQIDRSLSGGAGSFTLPTEEAAYGASSHHHEHCDYSPPHGHSGSDHSFHHHGHHEQDPYDSDAGYRYEHHELDGGDSDSHYHHEHHDLSPRQSHSDYDHGYFHGHHEPCDSDHSGGAGAFLVPSDEERAGSDCWDSD